MFFEVSDVSLVSPNRNEHWANRWKREKGMREKIRAAFFFSGIVPELPCDIVLQRLFKGGPFDGDNLTYAFKGVRDCVADLVFPGLPPGLADGDSCVSWKYEQERAKENSIKIFFLKRL